MTDSTAAPAGRLLLGVDGGNTKAIALVAGSDGSVLGAGRVTGCADPYAVGLDDALEAIVAAADRALAEAGGGSVGPAVFSLAGADWPEDHARLAGALGARWPAAVVVNDGIGALRAALPGGPGVVIVLGTGAATAARAIDGRTWHTSFWQEPQGARELGALALQAVYRAELAIDPPTALTDRVLARLGATSVEAVLHGMTRREGRLWAEPAILAATLLDAAEDGDPTATAIVTRHGAALGRTGLAAARRVGIDGLPFALALAGGVARHPGRLLADAIVGAVREGAPEVRVVRPELEPAAGALLLAFDAAGIAVDGPVRARLLASLPPDALYDTHPGTLLG